MEEQQEKLRRFVDASNVRSFDILRRLQGDSHDAAALADSHPPKLDPVRILLQPTDTASVSDVFDADNSAVTKMVRVLFFDCVQILNLCGKVSGTMCMKLLLFAFPADSHGMLLEGEPQKAFSRSLSLFMELSDISHRLSAAMGNLLQQLDAICQYNEKTDGLRSPFNNVILTTSFLSLGEGLAMMLTLDEIVKQNSHIKTYASLSMRMLDKVKLDPQSFGLSMEDVYSLDKAFNQLEKLFSIGFFQRLLGEDPLWKVIVQRIKCNRKFFDASLSCINDSLKELLGRLDTSREYPCDRRKALHLFAFFIFISHLQVDTVGKRVGKVISNLLEAVPVIYVEGGLRFLLPDLLANQLPHLSEWPMLKEVLQDPNLLQNNYLRHLNETLSRDFNKIRDVIAGWVVAFHSTLYPMDHQSTIEANFRIYMHLIIQGLVLANRLQVMTISMLDLHAMLKIPVKREKLQNLCHMVILLKIIQYTFKKMETIYCLPHILNLIQRDIESLFLLAKDELHMGICKEDRYRNLSFLSSLMRSGQDSETQLKDSLSLVLLALKMVESKPCDGRHLVLHIALDIVQSIGHLKINYAKVKKLTAKIAVVSDWQNMVCKVTDCGFLYQRKEMIPTWFSLIYSQCNKESWLEYLVDAFCDSLLLMKFGNACDEAVVALEEEILNSLNDEIIFPLCRDIETDLRLHVHSIHLKDSVHVNPTQTGVRDLSWYLQIKPLRLPSRCVDIKLHVENYLNSAFYNHTVMSSYNWKTYSEMRHLAELKYGLVLHDIHLPDRPLDLVFDILEIKNNIDRLVSDYTYNINTQIFIEKTSENQGHRALKVINVESIAASIAVHGLGILDYVVNSALQFIAMDITILSQLIADNIIKSILVEEYKFWKDTNRSAKGYPFVRAEEIRKSTHKTTKGVHHGNILDRINYCLTRIGNALGFIRILQTGARHHGRISSRCTMGLENLPCIGEDIASEDSFDRVAMARRILHTAQSVKFHDHENMKSLSFMCHLTSKELKVESVHFKGFFLIIPALTINSVDSVTFTQDLLRRRGWDTIGNQFTPCDGFILGVAYILKIFDQEKSFDQLSWFPSAREHYEKAIFSVEESCGKDDHKTNRLSLLWYRSDPTPLVSSETQKVIDNHKRCKNGMELLECGLSVARTILL